MNFIRVFSLLCLMSTSNCAITNKGDQSGPDKNVKMNEIILYINSASQITYQDGIFEAKVQEHADALNKLLKGKQVSVRKLGGKHEVSKTDSIFYLTVNEKHSEDLVKEFLALPFVNGAYVKPEADEA